MTLALSQLASHPDTNGVKPTSDKRKGITLSHADVSRISNDAGQEGVVEEIGTMCIADAAWRRWEEVGGLSKGMGILGSYPNDKDGQFHKPDMPYILLIRLVLAAHPRKTMTLSQIYTALERRWPYFSSAGTTWRNSIRHNLSLNDCFVNFKDPAGTSKGGYWTTTAEPIRSTRRNRKAKLPYGTAASQTSQRARAKPSVTATQSAAGETAPLRWDHARATTAATDTGASAGIRLVHPPPTSTATADNVFEPPSVHVSSSARANSKAHSRYSRSTPASSVVERASRIRDHPYTHRSSMRPYAPQPVHGCGTANDLAPAQEARMGCLQEQQAHAYPMPYDHSSAQAYTLSCGYAGFGHSQGLPNLYPQPSQHRGEQYPAPLPGYPSHPYHPYPHSQPYTGSILPGIAPEPRNARPRHPRASSSVAVRQGHRSLALQPTHTSLSLLDRQNAHFRQLPDPRRSSLSTNPHHYQAPFYVPPLDTVPVSVTGSTTARRSRPSTAASIAAYPTPATFTNRLSEPTSPDGKGSKDDERASLHGHRHVGRRGSEGRRETLPSIASMFSPSLGRGLALGRG